MSFTTHQNSCLSHFHLNRNSTHFSRFSANSSQKPIRRTLHGKTTFSTFVSLRFWFSVVVVVKILFRVFGRRSTSLSSAVVLQEVYFNFLNTSESDTNDFIVRTVSSRAHLHPCKRNARSIPIPFKRRWFSSAADDDDVAENTLEHVLKVHIDISYISGLKNIWPYFSLLFTSSFSFHHQNPTNPLKILIPFAATSLMDRERDRKSASQISPSVCAS